MTEYPQVCLPRTQARTIVSKERREYRIWIATPKEAAPPEGFPVLYLLDANALFGTVVESMRIRARRAAATGVTNAIIVGIAYAGTEPFDGLLRTYDFTFGPSIEEPQDAAGTGGAGEFLAFLETQLKPLIRAEFPANPAREALFGHSLGAFFGLNALLRSEATFQTYILASPSVWWNPPALFDRIKALRQTASTHRDTRNVLITVAEYDQKTPPWMDRNADSGAILARRTARRMVDYAHETAEALKEVGSIGGISFHEFAGEDHVSALLPAVSHGLRFFSSVK